MSIRRAARALRPSLVCLALAFPLVLAGCGKSTATVSGMVKYKGEPLPSGTVILYGANNEVARGGIGEDGKYTVADAPLGEVKVAVQVQDMAPSLGGGGGAGRPGGPMMPGAPPAGGPPGAGDAMANGPPGQAEHVKPMPGGDRKVVPIPKQYMSPDTSNLSTSVKKGKQTYNIELE